MPGCHNFTSELELVSLCCWSHLNKHFFFPSDHLCSSELHSRRLSLTSGEKLLSGLQPQAAAYCQDQNLAESEPDPGRDIELELCALDLEDPEQQEAQVSSKEPMEKIKNLLLSSYQRPCSSQDASSLLSPSCSSPGAELPQTEGPSIDKLNAHLLKKMAFR